MLKISYMYIQVFSCLSSTNAKGQQLKKRASLKFQVLFILISNSMNFPLDIKSPLSSAIVIGYFHDLCQHYLNHIFPEQLCQHHPHFHKKAVVIKVQEVLS